MSAAPAALRLKDWLLARVVGSGPAAGSRHWDLARRYCFEVRSRQFPEKQSGRFVARGVQYVLAVHNPRKDPLCRSAEWLCAVLDANRV